MSSEVKSSAPGQLELAWLLQASESLVPLNESSPVFLRHGVIQEGPPRPHPEWHPCCEISIRLKGGGWVFVRNEKAYVGAGDVLMLSAGVPHWGRIDQYPLRSVTVYFLPWVPIEMGPGSDGVRVLRRFTAHQSLEERVLRPPPALRSRLTAKMQEMVDEFERNEVGRQMRLCSLLAELLLTILRWEHAHGRRIGGEELEGDWRPLMKALQYLRAHYSEPIYAHEVARAAAVSETCLNRMFRKALGMSWVRFLQGYRIQRAAVLLNESGYNVTKAALAVGFDSLPHFNKNFRAFMGMAPRHFHPGQSGDCADPS